MSDQAVCYHKQFCHLQDLESEAKANRWQSTEVGQGSGGRIYRWEKQLNCLEAARKFFILLMTSCLIYPLFSAEFRNKWKDIKTEKQFVLLQQPKPAVLYMSITGNPAHLGHMAAIAAAIDALQKRGNPITQAYISLSSQSYLANKIVPESNKIVLSHADRAFLLEGTIREAAQRQMFKDVPVTYWDDQQEGVSDHPDSYNRLARSLPDKDVYLVAGNDLCQRMNNWPMVKNAIVVKRANTAFERPALASSQATRIYTEALYPELAGLSSTAVQERRVRLVPESLQVYFDQRRLSTAS